MGRVFIIVFLRGWEGENPPVSAGTVSGIFGAFRWISVLLLIFSTGIARAFTLQRYLWEIR